MDNRHMDYLRAVVDEDVAHLEEKEKTYGGSWKKRGGIGAFMMLARKWDRIENLMANRHAYDIFDGIYAGRSGEDSTVLAEVRDLRRYLVLVEAEMMARGVVAVSLREAGKSPVFAMPYAGGIPVMDPGRNPVGGLAELVGRPLGGEGALPYTLGHEPDFPGTPDDGRHHSGLRPPPLPKLPERYDDGLPEDPHIIGLPYFWVKDPLELREFHNLDRRRVSPEFWDHLPRLRLQLNHQEWKETLPEYRGLYTYWANEGKYIMDPEYRQHWGQDT